MLFSFAKAILFASILLLEAGFAICGAAPDSVALIIGGGLVEIPKWEAL